MYDSKGNLRVDNITFVVDIYCFISAKKIEMDY